MAGRASATTAKSNCYERRRWLCKRMEEKEGPELGCWTKLLLRILLLHVRFCTAHMEKTGKSWYWGRRKEEDCVERARTSERETERDIDDYAHNIDIQLKLLLLSCSRHWQRCTLARKPLRITARGAMH